MTTTTDHDDDDAGRRAGGDAMTEARIAELAADLAARMLAAFEPFDAEWSDRRGKRRASRSGVRETYFAAGWAAGLDEGYEAGKSDSAELARLRALVAAQGEALQEYAEQSHWFKTVHVQHDGYPQPVWAWDDMREPWTMAQQVLAAGATAPAAEGARPGEDDPCPTCGHLGWEHTRGRCTIIGQESGLYCPCGSPEAASRPAGADGGEG